MRREIGAVALVMAERIREGISCSSGFRQTSRPMADRSIDYFSIIEWIWHHVRRGHRFAAALHHQIPRSGGRRATYTHGNTFLEVVWTIVPAIILIVLFMLSQSLWWSIKGSVPATDFQVQVMGKQFNWIFTYPGPDGVFGTVDDLSR